MLKEEKFEQSEVNCWGVGVTALGRGEWRRIVEEGGTTREESQERGTETREKSRQIRNAKKDTDIFSHMLFVATSLTCIILGK